MSFIGILLIFVLAVYLLRPVLGWLLRRFMVWQMQRQMQRMMDQAFGASGGRSQGFDPFASQQNGGKKAKRSTHRRSKIFSKTDGEYVDFEEIQVYQQGSEQSQTQIKYREESQVSDAEWEDL